MSEADITRLLAEFREIYPPLITFEQAAAISHTPKGTIEDHSSRGLFDAFKFRYGKRCLLDRDRFVRFLLTREAQINSFSQMPDLPVGPATSSPVSRTQPPFNKEANL